MYIYFFNCRRFFFVVYVSTKFHILKDITCKLVLDSSARLENEQNHSFVICNHRI
jgi:hypothetical protein